MKRSEPLLAQNPQALREQRNLSLAEVSGLTGVSKRMLWQMAVCVLLGVGLLVAVHQSLSASTGPTGQGTAKHTTATLASPGQIPLFADEFDGTALDRLKWDVYAGTPSVSDGWLTLPGADIQSIPAFSCGTLQGVIRSTDWKPYEEFTDSSFGFEVWEGADGRCHQGVVLKASGQLGLLSSRPDSQGNCAGQSAGIPGRHPDDPYYQDYAAIPSWAAISAAGTVTFTLTWSEGVTLELSGGQASGQVHIDTSPAIPGVPLKIRLYAVPAETYEIDFVRLYPCYAVYLPMATRD
jgi:hypothetical protein